MPHCQKTIRRQCHGKHIPPFCSVKEFSVKTISRALTYSNEDRPFLKFVNSKSHLKYSIDMLESCQTWRREFVLIVVYWSVTSAKKISNFTPVLSIRIVLDSFYLPIFYVEKFFNLNLKFAVCGKRDRVPNGRNIVGQQLPTLLLDSTCCLRLHTKNNRKLSTSTYLLLLILTLFKGHLLSTNNS